MNSSEESDPFWDAWLAVSQKEKKAGLESLTCRERTFYALNLLRGAVLRGGFHTYFDLASREEIEVAKRAFRENGAPKIAELVEKAESIIFSNGVSKEFEEQLAQLLCWSEEEIEQGIEPEWSVALDAVNKEFYAIAEVAEAVVVKYFEENYAD
ncbi:DMP19 family protein [Thiosocius teredinicola]|uniref:DMP19 family protein n=1 Tax=Thiosocius teredinicola TaxID=1973002 RepID=UPI0009910758